MDIQQLIYTKVPQQESPWKKTDYHTVFYPTTFLTRGELAEVERKIHFQGQALCDHKLVWFWQQIGGSYYLVIFRLQTLPDEVDWQGRVGSFLCHAFFFPPQLWQKVPRPLACMELVKDKIITSSSGALSSPSVDRNTGNMAPLTIQDREWERLDQQVPKDLSEEEWRLALALIRSATLNIQNRPVILCKGSAEIVADLFDRLFAFLPTDLKVQLACDSVMDGANLAQCPVRLGGFSQRLSYGTNVLLITTDPWTVDTSGKWRELFQPTTPFERWFDGCRDEVVVPGRIDEAYRLSSQLLNESMIRGNGGLLLDCQKFVKVNRQFLDDIFQERCTAITGAPTALLFNGLISSDAKLDYLLRGISNQRLAPELEKQIFANPNVLNSLVGSIPASLVESCSLSLQMIFSFWQGRKDMLGRLVDLGKNDAETLIRLLVDNGVVDQNVLRKMMVERMDLFDRLLVIFPSMRPLIREIMLCVMRERKPATGIEEILVDQALSHGNCNALLSGKLIIAALLDDFVRQGKWQRADLKLILRWARRNKERVSFAEYPFLEAVVKPDFMDVLLRQLDQHEPQGRLLDRNSAKQATLLKQHVPSSSGLPYREQDFLPSQETPNFFKIMQGVRRQDNQQPTTLTSEEERIPPNSSSKKRQIQPSLARHDKLIEYLMTERKVSEPDFIRCGFDADIVQKVFQTNQAGLFSKIRGLFGSSK